MQCPRCQFEYQPASQQVGACPKCAGVIPPPIIHADRSTSMSKRHAASASRGFLFWFMAPFGILAALALMWLVLFLATMPARIRRESMTPEQRQQEHIERQSEAAMERWRRANYGP